jgi:hypothetical protein
MRISLLQISLLRMRFYVYFANAILWLMRIFGFFISLVRFFGLIWLMQIFTRIKSRIRQEPSVPYQNPGAVLCP